MYKDGAGIKEHQGLSALHIQEFPSLYITVGIEYHHLTALECSDCNSCKGCLVSSQGKYSETNWSSPVSKC
jgi:hypothetical protein